MTKGIVYIVTERFNCAVSCGCSILSVRRFSDVPITVLTDSPVVEELSSIANIKLIKIPDGFTYPSRWIKTQLDKFTPYDKTLYLDSDVLCVDKFDELWNYPDDLVIADDIYPIKNVNGVEYANYNSGVMLFGKIDLFDIWHNHWLETSMLDQPALAVALSKWKGKLRVVDKYVYNWNVRSSCSKFVHYWSNKRLSVFPKEDVTKIISMLDPDGLLK